MTVTKPRSRMISVRLSEDEYLALQQLCTVTGARSISDLTRDAMQGLLHKASREDPMGEFRHQMNSLMRTIEELSERVALSKTEVGS
jgi:hypothetical protein